MTIERVGVVGCGLMGAGIAEVCARAGCDVIGPGGRAGLRPSAGRERIEQSLDARGAPPASCREDERDAALARLAFTTDIGEMADRQLVIEAVVENEPAKIEVFALLDKVVESTRRHPRLEHLVDPHHEAGHGHPAARARSSACTSSTRCRSCASSSWCTSLLTSPRDPGRDRRLRRPTCSESG